MTPELRNKMEVEVLNHSQWIKDQCDFRKGFEKCYSFIEPNIDKLWLLIIKIEYASGLECYCGEIEQDLLNNISCDPCERCEEFKEIQTLKNKYVKL